MVRTVVGVVTLNFSTMAGETSDVLNSDAIDFRLSDGIICAAAAMSRPQLAFQGTDWRLVGMQGCVQTSVSIVKRLDAKRVSDAAPETAGVPTGLGTSLKVSELRSAASGLDLEIAHVAVIDRHTVARRRAVSGGGAAIRRFVQASRFRVDEACPRVGSAVWSAAQAKRRFPVSCVQNIPKPGNAHGPQGKSDSPTSTLASTCTVLVRTKVPVCVYGLSSAMLSMVASPLRNASSRSSRPRPGVSGAVT